ncbi:MAG: isocitrate lyase/PEP mutase family protein [Xanthobacteraceae bacterium]|nr:isocitrate lyase/PEP mutase family protein [Xanthobacteraceae bacterium]
MRNTTKLKQMFSQRRAIPVPGAANAMFAKVVEAMGFEAVYVTGAGVANMHLGAPDIGLTTMTEVSAVLAATADAVSIPIIVDGDTGFGSALNVIRCVRWFERHGASAIQLEDQVFPKRCGHFSGKHVIPVDEMVSKIKAAADTRTDSDFQIIARTDALAIEGIDHALERARAYIEAGADVTFVEAPTSESELARIACELDVPQVANVVFGGRTPDLGRDGFAKLGFSVVLYANAVLQAALKASFEVLTELRDKGSLTRIASRLASFEERQRAVAKEVWDEREKQFGPS